MISLLEPVPWFVSNTKGSSVSRSNLDPLRIDPTRLLTVRRQFNADLKRRFRWLAKRVVEYLVVRDALDLKDKRDTYALHATDGDFRFNTDPQKLDAFNLWFAEQVRRGIFLIDPGTPPGQPWLTKYVVSAWKRGLISAYIASKLASGELTTGQEEFLRSAFGSGILMDTVRLLATRTFEDLKGVTSAMSTQMSRILSQGLIDGSSPLKIVKQMVEEIDNLTKRRALLIARTELTRVHAEAQLAAFERLGVREVGARVEYVSAMIPGRTCPICASLNGKIFKVEKAHGIIPKHPNCLCVWAPYIPVANRK